MEEISASKTIFLSTVDSTNEEAKRRINEIVSPTWIIADKQVEGKGRHGKTWFDGKGNFTGSLVFLTSSVPSKFFLYGFFIGIALYDTIKHMCNEPLDLFLKWPNDIILNNRKLSGILIESQKILNSNKFFLILGIGVNLNSAPQLEEKQSGYDTICLADVLGHQIEEKKFFEFFKIEIAKLERAIEIEGLEKIVDYWLKRTYEIGDRLEIKNYKGERFTGCFTGIDQDGGILISTGNTTKRIYSGDVFFES